MQQDRTPYTCHVFVCVNDREGARKSCADDGAVEVRAELKRLVTAAGLKPRVRVSPSGCLGVCTEGPNVMIYPQGLWFKGVTPADTDALFEVVQDLCRADA